MEPWADPERERGVRTPPPPPPTPGKSQVPISFLRDSGTDNPSKSNWTHQVQSLLRGVPYGPLWNTLMTKEKDRIVWIRVWKPLLNPILVNLKNPFQTLGLLVVFSFVSKFWQNILQANSECPDQTTSDLDLHSGLQTSHHKLCLFVLLLYILVNNQSWGAQWLSGRVFDSRPRGRGFEPHRRHCVVVLEQDTFILA